MLVVALLGGWVLFVSVFLIAWAWLHVEARAAAGVDEERYANGLEQFPPSSRRAA